MHALRVLVFCVMALPLSAPVRADEPKKSARLESESSSDEKKPDYAKLLVGKWVRTDGQYAGTRMEYSAGGRYTTASVARQQAKQAPLGGKWKVMGDAIVQTLDDGPYSTDTSVTVTKLTETEFRFKNKAGQEATYERVVDKEKEKK